MLWSVCRFIVTVFFLKAHDPIKYQIFRYFSYAMYGLIFWVGLKSNQDVVYSHDVGDYITTTFCTQVTITGQKVHSYVIFVTIFLCQQSAQYIQQGEVFYVNTSTISLSQRTHQDVMHFLCCWYDLVKYNRQLRHCLLHYMGTLFTFLSCMHIFQEVSRVDNSRFPSDFSWGR